MSSMPYNALFIGVSRVMTFEMTLDDNIMTLTSLLHNIICLSINRLATQNDK